MCIRSAACESIAGGASLRGRLGGGGQPMGSRLVFSIPIAAEAWAGERSREGLSRVASLNPNTCGEKTGEIYRRLTTEMLAIGSFFYVESFWVYP